VEIRRRTIAPSELGADIGLRPINVDVTCSCLITLYYDPRCLSNVPSNGDPTLRWSRRAVLPRQYMLQARNPSMLQSFVPWFSQSS
jgi:hypothetical protein